MAAGHSPITDKAMRAKGYLLVCEAARKVGVAPQTVYRWIDAKKVEGFTAAYRRYVRWSSVLKHFGPEASKLRGLHQNDLWVETNAH